MQQIDCKAKINLNLDPGRHLLSRGDDFEQHRHLGVRRLLRLAARHVD